LEKSKTSRIDTTLGELIAAASEVAFEYSDNAEEAYAMARLALIEILKQASYPTDTAELQAGQLKKKGYLH
jgi:hypothetical protein